MTTTHVESDTRTSSQSLSINSVNCQTFKIKASYIQKALDDKAVKF
jgi:hypothetical protein